MRHVLILDSEKYTKKEIENILTYCYMNRAKFLTDDVESINRYFQIATELEIQGLNNCCREKIRTLDYLNVSVSDKEEILNLAKKMGVLGILSQIL